jgi:serine/threonine protein phosphatase PrpC
VAIDIVQLAENRPELTLSTSQWRGQRQRQEDSLFACPIDVEESAAAGAFFGVADGMGGETGGDQASQLATSAFASGFEGSPVRDISARLGMALEAANDAIAAAVRDEPECAGMGTTLLGCCAFVDRLYWISSGDSLLLLLRNHTVERLNADHSFGALKSDSQFKCRLDSNTPDYALVSCLTGGVVELIDCPLSGFPLQPGDLIVAASDGLETLSDDDVLECLRPDPRQLAENLIQRVRGHATEQQDNVSVVVLSVNGGNDSNDAEAPGASSDAMSPAEPARHAGVQK